MDSACPFVVTVASEKGGVGKTTIATNLAVYLKALREDLPVTIASFDNHFSVDAMFAIGRNRGSSVAGLFNGTSAGELARLGEYGVQFMASERHLEPPDDDVQLLAGNLAQASLPGILVLDTRPVIDYFTRSALAAADLVLVPVKDRSSLVNAASIQSALKESGGNPEHVWLLPSLIDARLKLREGIGLEEFLRFSARERGHRVLDFCISKSPKVEGLATSFSRRIHPVLSHGRGTVVHSQLRALAGFVLARFDATPAPVNRQRRLTQAVASQPAGRRLRLLAECPLCAEPATGEGSRFFESLPSRRRGYLHRHCLQDLFAHCGLASFAEAGTPVLLSTREAGLEEDRGSLAVHLLSGRGELMETGNPSPAQESAFTPLLRGATGRLPQELHHHVILIGAEEPQPGKTLEAAGYQRFADLRRRALQDLRNGGPGVEMKDIDTRA